MSYAQDPSNTYIYVAMNLYSFDVSVVWGAEIGSDHHLVLMKAILMERVLVIHMSLTQAILSRFILSRSLTNLSMYAYHIPVLYVLYVPHVCTFPEHLTIHC